MLESLKRGHGVVDEDCDQSGEAERKSEKLRIQDGGKAGNSFHSLMLLSSTASGTHYHPNSFMLFSAKFVLLPREAMRLVPFWRQGLAWWRLLLLS